jgi:transposase
VYGPGIVKREHATSLPDDPAELRAMLLRVIDERDARQTEHDARVARLTVERDDAVRTLKLYLAKRFGPRIETLDPAQLGLFADEVKATERQAAAETIAVPSHTRRKGGPKPLPEGLPRETVVHGLSAEERACPCCSRERLECARSRHEVVEIEPAKLKVVVHETVHYLCPECRGRPASGRRPSLPLPKGYAAASLLAYVAVSKFADHAPLYRQDGMLARSGLDLSRSSMCGWMLGCAELLEPLIDLMRRDVRASKVIQSDDTTVPTLGLVKGRAKDARLWCYVGSRGGDADHRHAVFEYTVSREGKWPQRWLEGFTGYLQTDAFAGYGAVCAAPGAAPGGAIEVGCWAHARRGFFDARDLAPGFCREVLDGIAGLYAVEREATERRLSHDERRELRERLSRPQLDAVLGLLESRRHEHLPKSPLRQATEYVLTRRGAFSRYLDEGAVEIDNNACERCMRSPALGRKNWLFAGSADGGRAIASWLTVIQSSRLCEAEPFAYVSELLTKLAEYRDMTAERKAAEGEAFLRELLPAAWLTRHPEKRLALGR